MAGLEIKKKQLIRPDLRNLIKYITKFQEQESEFKQCENYALSHILHHTYLSVNRHQVQRSINGLINKFAVHGLTEKAKRLEMLVEKFVNSEQFKNHEEADVEWCILLLLINLSDNPTSLVLQEDLNPLPVLIPPERELHTNEEPDLNWGHYLKEGWEEFRLPDDDAESIVWSELESDEEIVVPTDSCTPIEKGKSASHSFSDYVLADKKLNSKSFSEATNKEFEKERDARMRICDEKLSVENWLKSNVQFDWWNSSSIRLEPKSPHPSAKLAFIWEDLMNKHTQGMIPIGSALIISEYKVIREVLWILRTQNETFLFTFNKDGRIVPKENVSIPSLTPVALSLYLKRNVCVYAEMVRSLVQFIDNMGKAEYNARKPPNTYQAYTNALKQQLVKFFTTVSNLEKKLKIQDGSFTLIYAIEMLRPSLSKLRYLYCLHKTVIYDWKRCEGWFSSVRLLAGLYEELFTNWKDEYAEVCTGLFINTFKVYLQIVDTWLSKGKIEDWRDEFIVKRFDGNLKIVAYEKLLNEIKMTRLIKILKTIERIGSDLDYISKLDEVAALTTRVKNKGCLFKEVLELLKNDLLKVNVPVKNIVDSGKSLNSIESEDINNAGVEEIKGVTSESFKKHLCSVSSNMKFYSSASISLADVDMSLFNLTTKNLLNSPWLAMMYDLVTQQRSTPVANKENEYSEIAEITRSQRCGSLPLHHFIERNVIELFTERQKIASTIIVETMLCKYKLPQHLALLGSVFVLESYFITNRFYASLFHTIKPVNIEQAEFSMNVLLEECVENIVSQSSLLNNVQFSVRYIDNGTSINYNIIDCIHIDYKVEIPLNFIITKTSLEIYNCVFKFLLKIEWALSRLHTLRFSDFKETPSDRLQVRTLYKLRMFLMHCVTTLHSYFVAFTPKQLRTELESNLLKAVCMEELVNAHNNYLAKLKSHCLLDKGNVIVHSVKKLLVICGDLANCWKKQSEGTLTNDELVVLEDEYTKAHFSLHAVLKLSIGNHSNPSLRLLCGDIEGCLPIPSLVDVGQGDYES